MIMLLTFTRALRVAALHPMINVARCRRQGVWVSSIIITDYIVRQNSAWRIEFLARGSMTDATALSRTSHGNCSLEVISQPAERLQSDDVRSQVTGCTCRD